MCLFKVCTGGDSCCSTSNKCGEDEGDCDKDSHCKDGLKCGKNNCSKKSGLQWDATDDCCYKPPGITQIAVFSLHTQIY